MKMCSSVGEPKAWNGKNCCSQVTRHYDLINEMNSMSNISLPCHTLTNEWDVIFQSYTVKQDNKYQASVMSISSVDKLFIKSCLSLLWKANQSLQTKKEIQLK